jgi:hypothetical protein
VRVRLTGEAGLANGVLGREAEHVRRRLGQAVALDDRDAPPLPRLEQRLRHRRAADDGQPQAGEVDALEGRLVRHEEVRRRHAHHRRDALLLDEAQRAAGLERRLEHDGGALPPREQRLDVPAADVELRQHLQDDVLGAQARGEVEREVRPEAVAVREQRALRLPGRAGGVDEQQRVVRLRSS